MTTIADHMTDNIVPIDPKTKSWTVMVDTTSTNKLGVGFHEDGVIISFYKVFGGDYPVTMKRVMLSYQAFEDLVAPSPSQPDTSN